MHTNLRIIVTKIKLILIIYNFFSELRLRIEKILIIQILHANQIIIY